jgi:hypothetical protein
VLSAPATSQPEGQIFKRKMVSEKNDILQESVWTVEIKNKDVLA